MAQYTYTKVVKAAQLLDELNTVPTLAPVGVGMARQARVLLAINDAGTIAIDVPDDVAKSVVDEVVAAHVPQPDPIVFSDAFEVEGNVRTTNATATEVYRAPLQTNRGYAGDFLLIGVDAGNGAVKVIRASIAAKRLGAGALMVGTPTLYAQHNDTAAAAWTAGANVQGNDFVITVTGAAGRSVDWNLAGTIVQFAPAGL